MRSVWRLVLPAAVGAALVALVVATVASAGPPRGWVFGSAQTQADVTFQTDSGQPASYEIFSSPLPITGLTCPGGAHAVFPFNGNPDLGECGPFPGPGLVTGLVSLTAASPFPCASSFGNQASFDSSTYTAQAAILSLNNCQATTPPVTAFSSHASFATDLRPQLTKQWNAFVERQLGQSASLSVGYIEAKTTPAGVNFVYDPAFWGVFVHQGSPPGAIVTPFHGALSGPGTVQISIDHVVSPGHCAWLTGSKTGFHPGSCGAPVWLPTVTKGQSWTFVDYTAFAPGTYTAEVRAADQGQVQTHFSRADMSVFLIRAAIRHK